MSFIENFWDSVDDRFHEQIKSISIKRKINARSYLFDEYDPYVGFYIILKGKFRLFNINEEGVEVTISVLEENNVIALVPIFKTSENYHAYCYAIEESEILFIERTQFIDLLYTNPELMMSVASFVIDLTLGFREKYLSVTLKSAEQRVKEFFISIGRKNESFQIPISKKYLASLLDITPESLSRILLKLKKIDFLKENEDGTYDLL